MYFDALTTAAMAGELQAALAGGRVQDVVLGSRRWWSPQPSGRSSEAFHK